MDGAHQLHAKGAVSYREQNNVPLIVAHPAYAGGKQCKAITSHVDIAPTLVAFTGAAADKLPATVKQLPGKNFASLLALPERADVNLLHDGVLFNYNMFAYLDGEFLEKAVAYMQDGGNPKEIRNSGIRPDMMKRGAVRSVYDGRYTFARHFSPKQHNKPTTLEDLLEYNDVELFDLQSDPHEMRNLATGIGQHREIVIAMNDKLNRLIEAEVGEDRGQMLPGGIEAGWEVTAETMAGA
jgi:arylsulfatase